MPKVKSETIILLNAFIDDLPTDARNKCALCNETLTHIVKQAEATTGAGTATVTRALAEKINDEAAPGDLVSPNALRNRVQYSEGLKCSNRANKSDSVEKPKPKIDPQRQPQLFPEAKSRRPPSLVPPPDPSEMASSAMQFATMAITTLERMRKDDPNRADGLIRVKTWINEQLA